jgi:hypothetical protein
MTYGIPRTNFEATVVELRASKTALPEERRRNFWITSRLLIYL